MIYFSKENDRLPSQIGLRRLGVTAFLALLLVTTACSRRDRPELPSEPQTQAENELPDRDPDRFFHALAIGDAFACDVERCAVAW